MARERRSRAMALELVAGLERGAQANVTIAVPVVVDGAGWSGNAGKNRQSEQR